jgi:hypothetical protein
VCGFEHEKTQVREEEEEEEEEEKRKKIEKLPSR